MNTTAKQALSLLGRSIAESGEVIATVAKWPDNAGYARDAHIVGAVLNIAEVRPAVMVLSAGSLFA